MGGGSDGGAEILGEVWESAEILDGVWGPANRMGPRCWLSTPASRGISAVLELALWLLLSGGSWATWQRGMEGLPALRLPALRH